MATLGLTGNFGMGKTTVLNLFAKHGAQTFSSDELVHDILQKPFIAEKLSHILGKRVLVKNNRGQAINKRRVADIIFSDSSKRRLVESVIHPEVRKAVIKLKNSTLRTSTESIVVFEVPLLFEADFQSLFDLIIVVYCSRETAIRRLTAKGFSQADIEKRTMAQIPITQKKALADILINNEGEVISTERRVKSILKKMK